MSIVLADATASALADQLMTLVDAGSGAGTLAVYTGDKPDSPADAPTGTLLVTFTLVDPAAAAAAAGIATWDTGGGIDAVTVAAGTAGWFRVADSDDNPVFDGDAGPTGSGVELAFDAATWTSGETVTLGSGTTTQPARSA